MNGNFYTRNTATSTRCALGQLTSTDCRKPPTVVDGAVTDFSPSSCNAYTAVHESHRMRSLLPGTHLALRNADRPIQRRLDEPSANSRSRCARDDNRRDVDER